jgi:hypothetical protein
MRAEPKVSEIVIGNLLNFYPHLNAIPQAPDWREMKGGLFFSLTFSSVLKSSEQLRFQLSRGRVLPVVAE